MDKKILRVQNKRLRDFLEQKQRHENELREKIQHLNNRKTSDDAKLYIFDRYWTQLDDDLRVLLERFNNSNKYEGANSSINTNVRSFLRQLNDWDKVEIEDKLKERVKFTTQSISKLILSYDK